MRTFTPTVRLRNPLLLFLALLISVVVATPAAAQTPPPAPTEAPSTAVAVTAVPVTPGPTAGTPNRAGLVVRFGDGSVQIRCVVFTEDRIGGDELLLHAGVRPVFGPAQEVCAIGGQGCPADDCFCQCPFPDCQYWGYYHLEKDGWRYADAGAGFYEVSNGAVEGWSWSQGDFSGGVPPPLVPFEQICVAAPTPAPTATLAPAATATPPPPPPAEIPEPASLLLAATGVAALAGLGFRLRPRK